MVVTTSVDGLHLLRLIGDTPRHEGSECVQALPAAIAAGLLYLS
jgi:hypothetical protein